MYVFRVIYVCLLSLYSMHVFYGPLVDRQGPFLPNISSEFFGKVFFKVFDIFLPECLASIAKLFAKSEPGTLERSLSDDEGDEDTVARDAAAKGPSNFSSNDKLQGTNDSNALVDNLQLVWVRNRNPNPSTCPNIESGANDASTPHPPPFQSSRFLTVKTAGRGSCPIKFFARLWRRLVLMVAKLP